jgi:heterokaryon incompatibility protein (HET)
MENPSTQSHRISDNGRHLCQACSAFPFDRHEDREAVTLGTVEELRSRDCQFCKLVVAAMFRFKHNAPKNPNDPIGVIWDEHRRAYSLDGWQSMGSRICFTEPDHPFQVAKIVSGTEINIGQVKSWISTCDQTHGERCRNESIDISDSHSALDELKSFRVIDVHQRCVVEPSPRTIKYLALSYVWGKAEMFRLIKTMKDELLQPQGLDTVFHLIPQTVKDAIEFVKQLGEHYLWVDSLCLVQDEEEDVSDGVNKM